jgi:hypothetical protein
MMAGPEDFERLGNLLGDACEAVAPTASPGKARDLAGTKDSRGRAVTAGGTPRDPVRRLALVWADVVGVEVAANARPVQLRNGRLVVSASSSVWAHTLQYMGEDLKARLNDRLGAGTIEQIAFRHAGWEERTRLERADQATADQTPPRTLTTQQKEALARLAELDLPKAIQEQIARAMKAAFVRGEQDAVR